MKKDILKIIKNQIKLLFFIYLLYENQQNNYNFTFNTKGALADKAYDSQKNKKKLKINHLKY